MGVRGTKDYETPLDFFRPRWELHHFNVDAAASDQNALVRGHDADCQAATPAPGQLCEGCYFPQPIGRYYTAETNGLDPAHYEPGDRVWVNPPFVNLEAWVALFREMAMDGGVMSEMLLPASTDTRWFMRNLWNDTGGHWRDGVEGHFVGRVQFLLDGQPVRDAKGKVVSSRQANLLVTMEARMK